jgi:hypothetical protein
MPGAGADHRFRAITVLSAFLLKLALAIGLAGAIAVSVSARAPRKPLPRADLRWLVLGALALDVVALLALLTHHSQLAVLLFAAGIATSTLAAWLSRASEPGGGTPGHADPLDEPPPEPGDAPWFDWESFERELRAYADRSRDLVSSR